MSAIAYRHRAHVKALPYDSPLVQKILWACDAIPPHPDHYLIVMVKHGTNAEGNPLDFKEIADKMNRRFISHPKRANESGVGRWELWTKERAEEHYERLEAGGGELWDRWTAL